MCRPSKFESTNALSKLLRNLRLQNHLTLQAVSEKTHLSGSYINRLENYWGYVPSIYVLKALAEVYHVDFETLLAAGFPFNNKKESTFYLDSLFQYNAI